MHKRGEFPKEVDGSEVVYRYIKSIGKGILKVMSKMGISTYQSYCGAQIFDAIGLSSDFVEKYFFGTATTIEGVGLKRWRTETVSRHRRPSAKTRFCANALEVGGEYAYRMRGEATCLDAGRGRLAAARRARQSWATVQGVRRDGERDGAAHEHDPRHVPHQGWRRALGRKPVSLDEVNAGGEISSSVSRPAPCPSARSAARRTRRLPSP
jgi:glutamate synthase (NADPH/NADH) large chain